MFANARNKRIVIVAVLAVITFLCFRNTIDNQFTNWDDDFYVTNDPYIKAFTARNLKTIFTEDITKNNYHPLCMLSLAVNYHFAQLNPMSYYLTNVLIHIANVILVFFLMLQLCRLLKMDEPAKLIVATFGALWFGVHPMHVESVGWIAERKDVLYAFFYIIGLICYLKYTDSKKMKWYWITFVMFLLSCLSKPMAVVFPLSLLCIDVLAERELRMKLITEKILFFTFSLICGGMAFYTQNKTGAIAAFGMLSIYERIMYASYGFVMYIVKIFNPTYLSTFYPYPYRYISGYLPTIYYASPFISLAILILPALITYKYKKEYFRVTVFGIGFLFVNLMFVLQFVSVGAAIMADRYSYVAYIGAFFLLAYLLQEAIRLYPVYKQVLLGAATVVSLFFAYLCYQRTFVWHDSETLLTDAIEKYPYRAMLSYKWRGNFYFDKGDLDKALEDYGVCITLRSADAKMLDRVGNIYVLKKDYPKAIDMYNKSLEVQNNVAKTYIDRSVAYLVLNDTTNAIRDFVVGIRIHPSGEQNMSEALFAAVQRGDNELAVKGYSLLLKFTQNNPFYFFYRGVAEFELNNADAAIKDWEIAAQFDNKDTRQSASYNLSVAYNDRNEHQKAYKYALMAQAAGYKVADDFMAKLKAKADSSASSK